MKIGLILVAAAALAGCSSQDAENIGQDAKNLAEHTGQAVGSMTMTGKIKFVLGQRKSIDMSGVDVSFKDGVATMTGTVKDDVARNHLRNAVEDIRGVDKVEDQLKVQP